MLFYHAGTRWGPPRSSSHPRDSPRSSPHHQGASSAGHTAAPWWMSARRIMSQRYIYIYKHFRPGKAVTVNKFKHPNPGHYSLVVHTSRIMFYCGEEKNRCKTGGRCRQNLWLFPYFSDIMLNQHRPRHTTRDSHLLQDMQNTDRSKQSTYKCFAIAWSFLDLSNPCKCVIQVIRTHTHIPSNIGNREV